MIRLNLLPPDAQGRRSATSAPAASKWSPASGSIGTGQSTSSVVWMTVVPAFIVAIGLFAYVYYSDVVAPERNRDEVQAQLDAVRTEVADLEGQYAHLREASIQYERQMHVIDILTPPNRILWSEKFNQISQCVPDNVFLTRIKVDEEVREIPTPETVAARDAWLALPEKERKGAAPELEMVPSIIQTLNIEGISFAEQRERRIQLVLDFWQNLVSHQSTTERGGDRAFMNHFNGLPFIDYNETQDVAGVEINAFKLVLRTVDLASLGQHS